MANCITCGNRLGFSDARQATKNNGNCPSCTTMLKKVVGSTDPELSQINMQATDVRVASIDALMLTTETVPNLNITKRIEIVTAECAFGMNIFKDLFAGVRDIVGGRSEALQKTMRDSRKTVLYELKKEAYEVGANAVVGVDLDYVELSSAGSMVMLVASGTAVIIEE